MIGPFFDFSVKVLGQKGSQGAKNEDFEKKKKHPQVFIQSAKFQI